MLKKIDLLESDMSVVVGTQFAFAEPPTFKCTSFNPNVYSEEMRTGINWINLGPRSLDAMKEQASEQKMFTVPGFRQSPPKLLNIVTDPEDAAFSCDPNLTQWLMFNPAPPAWAQTKEYWNTFEKEYPKWQLKELEKYVDGASWDNVIGMIVRTPQWVVEHLPNMAPSGNVNVIDMVPSQIGPNRPIPELAQHRTPVGGLYATGSAFGSWGMSSLCAAYTCYKSISADLGLTMPWKDAGRAY